LRVKQRRCFFWQYLSEELLKQEEISAEPTGNWFFRVFPYVLSAMRLRWRIEFVQIVDITRAKRL
jgi:hypothetical protein